MTKWRWSGQPEATAPKVPVAERRPAMREGIARLLRDQGYDVVEMSDGEQLWSEVLASPRDDDNPRDADLIVTEAQLPRLSGLEVLSRLRASERATPVIVMTSVSDPSVIGCARRHGALVLTKPFELGGSSTRS